MKVKDLFRVGDPIQSIGGIAEFLDHNNCTIVNKTKQDNAIILHIQRESDKNEGRAYLRVKSEFESVADQLLAWAYDESRVIGLTLNELRELDTNVNVTSVGGRMMFSRA